MPRTITRVSQIFKDAQDYIHQRSESLERNRKLESVKKNVKKWLLDNGTEDDDGNLVYSFPRELESTDQKRYAGVMLRKTTGNAFFQEDEVRGFLSALDAGMHYGRVFRKVEVMDPEELYVLQQEGTITEQALRGLLHYPQPSYALWPVESATPLEEEE